MKLVKFKDVMLYRRFLDKQNDHFIKLFTKTGLELLTQTKVNFDVNEEVNLDWWENKDIKEHVSDLFDNMYLKRAFVDGAKIQERLEYCNQWYDCDNPHWLKTNEYRIKKHTIVIDGKEIELSEESYKKLKESLK